jgi:tripartite-type tricarboxylate transporter receptor subunit TctC
MPNCGRGGVSSLITQNLLSLVAPAGTPKTIVDQIGAATRMALADEKLQQQFISSGA